ncbi:MAG: hypothetical protein HY775_06875 [Acidobacteria bacterium]|nr:hypothetical protein [Acidobacteriota bacterium]
MALILPPVADAADQTLRFTYGVDQFSWYWTKQKDVLVEGPDVPGAPIPAQRVRVSNPQAGNTLPVAVGTDEQGNPGAFERISAIQFSLADRGLPAGATITKFVLRLIEKDDSNEFPSFNDGGREILACRIGGYWPPGSAEVWATQPPYGGKSTVPSKPPFQFCAAGKRNASKPDWTFDLTQIAGPWGENPFNAFGVMLVPVLGDGSTDAWQINLKVPARDAEGNIKPDTKDFATVTLAFTPPAPAPSGGGGGGGGGGTTGFTPSAPPAYLPPAFVPPYEPAGTIAPPSVPSSVDPSSQDVARPGVSLAAPAQGAPPMPGIVWALVPVGLAALATVRTAIFQPRAATRAGSVIAAIRARNHERGGGVGPAEGDPLGRAGAALARGRAAVVEGFQRILARGSKR